MELNILKICFIASVAKFYCGKLDLPLYSYLFSKLLVELCRALNKNVISNEKKYFDRSYNDAKSYVFLFSK